MGRNVDAGDVASCGIGAVFGLIVASLIGVSANCDTVRNYQKAAIEHGAAQYNAKTGVFEWIEKGEK